MRVVLSAGKRGHYYMTANALQEHGVLTRFVTSTFFQKKSWRRRVFPRSTVRIRSDERLADRSVVSLWPVELAYRAAKPFMGRAWRLGMNYYNTLFDVASMPFVLGKGDIFHFANTYGVYSGRAAKRRGMKIVVDQQSVHPYYSIEVLEPEYKRVGMWDTETDRPMVNKVVKELAIADLILAPSRFVFEENVRFGIPEKRQRIVPFGVDTSLFSETTRVRKPDERFRILFVGRMSIRKGVHHLLEALRRLKSDARFELVFVGTAAPDLAPLLEEYRDVFRRMPTIAHAELPAIFNDSDCFCLPSLSEGSALVTYEAMASGLPCVVTRSAGSIIENEKDGLIVPIHSPDAIADAFRGLADDPERARELGHAARESACACDVEFYGERLLAAYRDFFGEEWTCAPLR